MRGDAVESSQEGNNRLYRPQQVGGLVPPRHLVLRFETLDSLGCAEPESREAFGVCQVKAISPGVSTEQVFSQQTSGAFGREGTQQRLLLVNPAGVGPLTLQKGWGLQGPSPTRQSLK